MKIVCTFSGGVDSTVLLYYLLSLGHEVVAVSFNYGQRHKIELEYASAITKKLGVDHVVLPLQFFNSLESDSSLLRGLGSPVVPCRNTIIVASAWALAESIKADGVAIGAHEGDATDFPDCRPEFLSSLESTLRMGSGTNIILWRPFVHIRKSEIIQKGVKLGVKFEETYTCYRGGKTACGECQSCLGRAASMALAKVLDNP